MPAVAIMVVLSVGSVGVGYWAGHRIVGMMCLQLIRHMSAGIHNQVTLMMEPPARMLNRVRQAVALRQVSLDNPRALAKELYMALDDEPNVDWLYFANERGGIVSIGRLQNGIQVVLMTDNFRAGVIREYAISAAGEITTLRKSGGHFDSRQKDWYQTAKQTGKSYWTKPYIGTVEPILGISLSAPAIDTKEKFGGVYGLDLILTRLSDFMKRQRLGETGQAFVMDDDGNLMAASGDTSPVVLDAKGRQHRLAATNASDQVVRTVARYLSRHPEVVFRARQGAVQSLVFKDPALGEMSAAVESFRSLNGGAWLIVSALPVSEFLSSIRKAGVLSLGLMVILIAGALAGGFWAVNRVLRPIEALTAAAYLIADGGWPEVPETGRRDEIGVLAQALDNMSSRLRRAHGVLEQRVAERTAELTETIKRLENEIEERIRIGRALEAETAARLDVQAELHEKNLLLLQQSRLAALGEMIGNIAHQWRQPLNLLGLLAQEMPMTYKRGDFSQEYLDATIKRMLETIRHMSKTIDDFRRLSSPDRVKVEFKVIEVVQRALSLVEGTLLASQIKPTLVVADDPTVNGYPNEFSQALLNIIINARDALLANAVTSPKITIVVASESGSCVVTVADNAGGIPEQIMGKIFDPYFTTKGPDKGTGIGLYMTKTIIEKNMGGRILVRNTAEGAEFRMELAKI
jgi:C4-dicarboxylate-specific signal transduction histidine kinase